MNHLYKIKRKQVDQSNETFFVRTLPRLIQTAILNSIFFRGFMKPGGVPDHYRAARLVLKDFVTGKLIYCQAPPNVDQVWTL